MENSALGCQNPNPMNASKTTQSSIQALIVNSGILSASVHPTTLLVRTRYFLMKSFLICICFLLSCISVPTIAQTIGDHHNAVVTNIIEYYNTHQGITYAAADKVGHDYVVQHNLGDTTISSAAIATDFAGSTTWQQLVPILQTKFNVSNAFVNIVTLVGNTVEANPPTDTNQIRTILTNAKNGAEYAALTEQEKSAYNNVYSDILLKSSQLWINQEGGTGSRAIKGTASRKACTCPFWSCGWKVALTDALAGTFAFFGSGANPAVTILFGALCSTVARCCTYSCCSYFSCH